VLNKGNEVCALRTSSGFTNRGIGRTPRRRVVEALAFCLHQLRLGAHLVEPERPQQPEGFALEEAFTSWRRIGGIWSLNFSR
jgi:hypothetical protein